MRSPGHSTAFALSVCLSCGTENLSESKNFGSGQKRTVVPVLRWPTLPISSSFEAILPSLKLMLYSLPPRLIQHSRCLRERVHHRHADPVQAAGELVGLVGEFAAGVQAREDQLRAAHLLLRVDVDRHAAAVVRDLERAVLVERDVDLLAVAGDRLIDAVVDDFVREVIGARGVRVHARPSPDGFETALGPRCRKRCRTDSSGAADSVRVE